MNLNLLKSKLILNEILKTPLNWKELENVI